MNALGAEDLESVKFDLEMADQDKIILEEQLASAKGTNDSFEVKLDKLRQA